MGRRVSGIALTLMPWLSAAILAGGCSSPGEGATVRPEPGDYALSIVPVPNFNIAMRMELEPDGHFRGHPTNPFYGSDTARFCEGTLTAEQHQRLTDVLVDARVFEVERPPDERCGIDTPIVDVEVSVVDGPWAGEANTFVYDTGCRDAALDRFLEVPREIVDGVAECDGEPIEYR